MSVEMRRAIKVKIDSLQKDLEHYLLYDDLTANDFDILHKLIAELKDFKTQF